MLRLLVLLLLFVGCGGNTQDTSGAANALGGRGGMDASIDMGGSHSGGTANAVGGRGEMDASIDMGGSHSGGTASVSGGNTVGGGSTCTPAGVDTFASRVPACGEGCKNACTFVVRLAYTTLEPLGWSVACGLDAQVDESAARQTALQKTGYGDATANAQTTGDLFIFTKPAVDFGGVGIVSTLSGVALFGGSIVWSGRGNITYPTTWETPDVLGHGCGFASVGLPSADANPASAAVGQTAIAHAFYYVLSSVDIYLYTPTVGATDYSVAEWLVFVSGLGAPGV